MAWYDYLGILASVLVLISYAISSTRILRLVNIIASAVFITYGIITTCFLGGFIGIITAVLNGCCIIVHIYYLVRGASSETTGRDSQGTGDDHLSN